MKFNCGTSDNTLEILNDYQKKICSSLASSVADILTKEAGYSIASFYDDYTPKYYHRHFDNFKNAMEDTDFQFEKSTRMFTLMGPEVDLSHKN